MRKISKWKIKLSMTGVCVHGAVDRKSWITSDVKAFDCTDGVKTIEDKLGNTYELEGQGEADLAVINKYPETMQSLQAIGFFSEN